MATISSYCFTASNVSGPTTKTRPAKTFQSFDLDAVELYETFLALRPKENQRMLEVSEIIGLLAAEYDAEMSFLLSRGGHDAKEFHEIGASVDLNLNERQSLAQP